MLCMLYSLFVHCTLHIAYIPSYHFCHIFLFSSFMSLLYGSDHSLGRCLVYGAFASPIGIVCDSTDSVPTNIIPKHISLGFCFMTPHCDLKKHITCHRYRPAKQQGIASGGWNANANISQQLLLEPVRTSSKRGHYSKYSSTFDGKITDSFM